MCDWPRNTYCQWKLVERKQEKQIFPWYVIFFWRVRCMQNLPYSTFIKVQFHANLINFWFLCCRDIFLCKCLSSYCPLKVVMNPNPLADTTDFVIKDKETEKKYKFVLIKSLTTARNSPFLTGWTVHVTKSCEPTPDQFEPIISKCFHIHLHS